MRTVGSASARPGEIDTGRLPIGETKDGQSIGLPVAIVNGSSEGETLYIQAVSDGDELNGLGVITRLVPRLDPAELTGTVVIVAIVNYHGFLAGEHTNPVDDVKVNRTYPGDPSGTSSERIAHITYQVAQEADYILDLHQGSTSRMIDEVRVRCGDRHRLHGECIELAKAFDAGFVLDQKGPDGQLARIAPDEGIPTIDPELGGSVGWNESSIESGLRGIERVLTHFGFLDGEITLERQTRAAGFEQYSSPVGGLVKFHASLGDRVDDGDPMFDVLSPFGEVEATVTADSEGIFWRTRRLPQVATGEYVCSLGTELDSV